MVVILSQCDNISLGCDLQSTATTHFDIGTFKLPNKRAVTCKHCHMKSIAMTITNKNISSITDVNAIGEVGDVFTANASDELSILIKDYNAVSLKTMLAFY